MVVLKLNFLSRSNIWMGNLLGDHFVENLTILTEFHNVNLEAETILENN